MKVTLREKPISKGTKKSLYLDYYPPLVDKGGAETRREFLSLYIIVKPKDKRERELNKASRQEAELICHIRQGQLIKRDFSFLTGEDADSVEAIFQELIDESKNPTSVRHYTALSDLLKEYAGTEYLTFSMFTPEFCQGYINYLRGKKNVKNKDVSIAQNTAAVYSASFMKFINLAEMRDKIFNVSKKVKGIRPDHNTKRSYLSLDELKTLAATPVDRRHIRCRDACFFSSSTGLRKGDIINLDWKDIIQEDGKHYIYFQQQKGKKQEYFPLNNTAVALLGKSKQGKVFAGVTGGKIKYLLNYWISDSGLDKHITFHSFRHTFASLLVKKGVNMAVIQKLLGHTTISTTSIYAHVHTEEKEEAVNRLDE